MAAAEGVSILQVINNMQVIWIEQHKQHVENQARLVKKLGKLKGQVKALTEENKKLSEAVKSLSPFSVPSSTQSSESSTTSAPSTSTASPAPTSPTPIPAPVPSVPEVPPKHIMLSYQWDMQPLAKSVYAAMKARGLPVWMDIEGGMSGSINNSMAYGVENAVVFVCIMTTKYQASVNCSKEYNYADACRKRIVPIKAENFTPTGSLGLIIAGLLYIQTYDVDFNAAMENLYRELDRSRHEFFPAQQTAPPAQEEVHVDLPWAELQTAVQTTDLAKLLNLLQQHPTVSAEFSIRILSAIRNLVYNEGPTSAREKKSVAASGAYIVAAMKAFPNDTELIQHATKIFWCLHRFSSSTYPYMKTYNIEEVLLTALAAHKDNIDIMTNIYAAWGLAPLEECRLLNELSSQILVNVRSTITKYQQEIESGDPAKGNIALLVVAAISVFAQFEYYKVYTGDLSEYALYIIQHLMKYYLNSRDVQATGLECTLVFVKPYMGKLYVLGPHLVETLINLMHSFHDDNHLIRHAMSSLVNFCVNGKKPPFNTPKAVVEAKDGKALDMLIEVFKTWKKRKEESGAEWRPNAHRVLEEVSAAGYSQEVNAAMHRCGVNMEFMRYAIN